MIEGIEPFYHKIAESIQSSISESWTTATVEAIFFSQSSRYSGEYIATENPQPKGFEVDLQIIRAFRGLRELFKTSGQSLWCRAQFELQADGKFKMNWGYDGCDENGFAHFNEQEEAERMKQIRIRQGLSS